MVSPQRAERVRIRRRKGWRDSCCLYVYVSNQPRFLEALTTHSTGQRENEVDSTVCIAIALSAGIILTTIHTQDFKDVVGDAAVGRVTLPIAYPVLSRVATPFFLVAWSWGISRTWQLDDAVAALMGVFGMGVGIRFVAWTDAPADKVSFYMYNVSHHPPSPFYSVSCDYFRCGWVPYTRSLDTIGCAWYHDQSGPATSKVWSNEYWHQGANGQFC